MKKIIIESGHSASDPGAISDGYKERDLTIHAKNRIAHYLKEFYPELTVLTDKDTDSLSQVISWIKSVEGSSDSIIYSLHWNSASSPSATGAETFVSDNASKKSKDMAKRALDVITKVSGVKSRGVKRENQSARKRLGILNTKSPATLIEFAFINNPKDREKIFDLEEEIYITLAHEMAYQAKN